MDRSFLEWPFLTPDHKTLALDVDAWARSTLPPLLEGAEHDLDGTCRRLVGALGDAGWLRYAVPRAYGGVYDTLDVRSLAILRETLAYHSGLADFAFAMQGLGSGAIALFGSDALKGRYLPAVGRGEKIAAFALSEPDAGSDAAAMTSTIERRDDMLELHGEKTWISNGRIADFYCVFARMDEGVSAIVLDADTPGLEVAERIHVIAPHPLARLRFDGCRVQTRVTREAAMAKLFATDNAQLVIDKAVQIFGGLGVRQGIKVEELYREIRALRIYEGASDVQKLVIARQHLSEYRAAKGSQQ